MIYDKIENSSAYRVKFRSFNLSVYDNESRKIQIDEMYKNYVLFK